MLPDKVYLQDGVSVPVVGFVSPAWENPKDGKNLIEYIRKDKILEILKDSKHLAGAALKIDEL